MKDSKLKTQNSKLFQKPKKIIVPAAQGLAWRGGGNYIYQEKLDGKFATRRGALTQSLFAGEEMRGGEFFAFDLLEWRGENIAAWPLRERWKILLYNLPADFSIVPVGNGGEFLEAIWANGGEGVVAKDLNAPWGAPMFACKRLETWLCRVAGFNGGTQSVVIEDAATGQARGNLPLLGGKCEQVKIGSIVKVEGFGLHASGLIREPRICKDAPGSWLVKF